MIEGPNYSAFSRSAAFPSRRPLIEVRWLLPEAWSGRSMASATAPALRGRAPPELSADQPRSVRPMLHVPTDGSCLRVLFLNPASGNLAVALRPRTVQIFLARE